MLDALIAERVEVALTHRFRLELADPETGSPMSPEERRELLTRGFREIAAGMGVDRFVETPVERLDQFVVMSVVKNHDTQGLLRSLVNSFMIAYVQPETAEMAFRTLLQLEALRAKIADDCGQQSPNVALQAAAKALDAQLARRMPRHSISNPLFRVLVGVDRLIVLAPTSIKDLPVDFDGWPVEYMSADLAVTAH